MASPGTQAAEHKPVITFTQGQYTGLLGVLVTFAVILLGVVYQGLNSEDAAIREQMQRNREETTAALNRLGDRVVESNREVGGQVAQLRTEFNDQIARLRTEARDQSTQLRTELVSTMQANNTQVASRFDRLEGKVDTLLGRISFGPTIELEPNTTYEVDAKGMIFEQGGGPVGTLPAVVKPVGQDEPWQFLPWTTPPGVIKRPSSP